MKEERKQKLLKLDGLKYRVGIKVTAFILMSILGCVSIIGAWSGVTMWKARIYSTPKESIIQENFQNATYTDGYNFLSYYLNGVEEEYLLNATTYGNTEIEVVSGVNPYKTEGVDTQDNLMAFTQTYTLGNFYSPYSLDNISEDAIAGTELEGIIERTREMVEAEELQEAEMMQESDEISEGINEETVVESAVINEGYSTTAVEISDGYTETTVEDSYVAEEIDFTEFVEYEIEVIVYVDGDYQELDKFYVLAKCVDVIYAVKDIIWWIVAIFLILSVTLFIWLLTAVGYRRGEERPVVCGTARMPYEIYLLFAMTVGTPLIIGGAETLTYGYHDGDMALVLLGCILASAMLSVIAMVIFDFVVRCKTGTLFSNWFVVKLCKKTKNFAQGHKFQEKKEDTFGRKLGRKCKKWMRIIGNSIPFMWKGILVYAGVSLGGLIIVFTWSGDLRLIMWLLMNAVAFPVLGYCYYMFCKLGLGCKSLGEGNLEYKIDTKYFISEFKEMGNNINAIAEGMEDALEEKIKSERMKTELISNVSHDIKTPLTSIVNYADLISKEETDNEKIHEYSQILLRQSDRLKRLTEDLVHASKVTSGNVEVKLSPCDISVLLNQAIGEYEQKLKDARLQIVMKQGADNAVIMADGRHMWRIFDNLLNNICKYAQEGTRVYLTVNKVEGTIVVEFKNISKYELNISENELMERFVRGDKSRHSEGNGLGLSIAKSLVEVQNGNMHVVIDGDLFKVVLQF